MPVVDDALVMCTDRESAFTTRVVPKHLLIAHRRRDCPALLRLLEKWEAPPRNAVLKTPSGVPPPHPPVANTSSASSIHHTMPHTRRILRFFIHPSPLPRSPLPASQWKFQAKPAAADARHFDTASCSGCRRSSQ
jgi:hypothetical protein